VEVKASLPMEKMFVVGLKSAVPKLTPLMYSVVLVPLPTSATCCQPVDRVDGRAVLLKGKKLSLAAS
jgi:hypothetical protein